jgi:hypothetical protein
MIPQKILREKVDFAEYGNLYNLIGMTAYSSHLNSDQLYLTPSTVTGVAIVNNQVAGLEVNQNGSKYSAHSSFFFVKGYDEILQNSYVYSQTAMLINDALSPWLTAPNSFHGPEWDGIEKIYLDIAKVAKTVILESPSGGSAWHTYKLSDGPVCKNWRMVLPPAPFSPVDATPISTCINFHSVLHSNKWTITVTISEERRVEKIKRAFEKGKGVGSPDPWVRSMKWTIITTHLLEGEYNYHPARTEMKSRLKRINEMHRIKERLQPRVLAAYKAVVAARPLCFTKNPKFPYITIMINRWWLTAGSVGMYMTPLSHYCNYNGPKDYPPLSNWYKETDYGIGILCINSLVFSNSSKVVKPDIELVILHELIHALLDERCSKELHGSDFQRMAEYLGLPKKYQD